TTDGAGQYQLSVPANTYRIFVSPASASLSTKWYNAPQPQGLLDGWASAADVNVSSTSASNVNVVIPAHDSISGRVTTSTGAPFELGHTVTGTVTDLSAAPISGATVRFFPSGSYLATCPGSCTTAATVTTAADGTYSAYVRDATYKVFIVAGSHPAWWYNNKT